MQLYTPEEIAASNLRVAMMIELANARAEKSISQNKPEAMSGVKQPIIARMEKGGTKPQLDTVSKALAPLGKNLYIGDLPSRKILWKETRRIAGRSSSTECCRLRLPSPTLRLTPQITCRGK